MNTFLTLLFKYQVGALRPHFLAVCKPNLTSLCSDDAHEYVDRIVCTGNTAQVKDARQSFLSGHSSMAFYSASFLIVRTVNCCSENPDYNIIDNSYQSENLESVTSDTDRLHRRSISQSLVL